MLMKQDELNSLIEPVGEGNRVRRASDDGDALEIPVWVDFSRSVLERERTFATEGASRVRRQPRLGRVRSAIKGLLSPPKPITRKNVSQLLALLRKSSDRPRLLVIGGGTVGQGLQPLYDAPDIQIVAFDIYNTTNIHFIADAHAIPLRDQSVDGVVVQAVLEHVLEPQTVVAEIWRVLKPDGIVYSETPFMQHVHEGAYDFTRFTESGHRYLFGRFEMIASGVCGGPGTQLVWSIDYFVRSLFRSRLAGKAAKLGFCWLPWLDALIPERFARDAASGFYFLGRRSEAAITPGEVIRFYQGAQAS